MHIILAIHHPLDRNAGAAGVTYQLSKEYQKLGHKVEICSYDNLSQRLPSKLKDLVFPCFLTFYVRKQHSHNPVDIVDATTTSGWFWGIIRRKKDLPLLVTRSHGLEHLYYAAKLEEVKRTNKRYSLQHCLYYGKIHLWEGAESLRRANLSLFLNHTDADYAIKHLGVNPNIVAIVANGIPTYFHNLPVKIDKLPEKSEIRIAQIGAYDYRKGCYFVEPALEIILRSYPHVRMSFMGTGQSEEYVKSRYSEQVRSQIEVLPTYQHEELPNLLQGYHIKLFPTLIEGFGLALVEAMACGLAPVTTTTGGSVEVVQNEQNGLLVPPYNSKALEAGLSRLIEDPDLLFRLRQKAYLQAQNYEWGSIAKHTLELYEECIQGVLKPNLYEKSPKQSKIKGKKMLNFAFDSLGWFIKHTGDFRGKGRVISLWIKIRPMNEKRLRTLPGGGLVSCDLSIPYELMVWFEAEEQKDLLMLQKLLKTGQTFVDCGANVGIWSIVAASVVGELGKVYAFEPNPSTFQKLISNIALNNWKNINSIPKAVGDGEESLYFKNEAAHNISRVVSASTTDTITVTQTCLDLELNNQAIDFIKLDVEGFELQALKGAENILKSCKPRLCVEFNTILAEVNSLRDWDVHQYLSKLGYVARRFEDALDHSSQTILSEDWKVQGYCNLYYTMQ